MPRDEEGRDLRARLLAGDTTASNDVVTAYLDDLADWLEKLNGAAQPDECLTAAEDDILAFIKNLRMLRALCHTIALGEHQRLQLGMYPQLGQDARLVASPQMSQESRRARLALPATFH